MTKEDPCDNPNNMTTQTVNEMYIKKTLALAAVVLAVALNSADARAALVISFVDATVAPGGSGHVDVLVSSDGTDTFQNYFLDFVVGGPTHSAEPINFVASMSPAPQLLATDPGYIFLGDSAEVAFPFGVDTLVTNPATPFANDLINVADETFSGDDRKIASTDSNPLYLLARLNFEAPVNATIGSTYSVSLDEFTSVFVDSDELPIFDFTSSPGTITIGAAAVPEPSGVALLAIGSLTWLARRRRRRLHSR